MVFYWSATMAKMITLLLDIDDFPKAFLAKGVRLNLNVKILNQRDQCLQEITFQIAYIVLPCVNSKVY